MSAENETHPEDQSQQDKPEAEQTQQPPPQSEAGEVKQGEVVGQGPIEQNKDARTMGMLCHLLGLFICFVGPLIIWLIKKDDYEFVDDQGKEALNFQITIAIGYAISAITWVFCVGVIIGIAVWICNIIFCIIGTIKANNGERYRYPICIRFIK